MLCLSCKLGGMGTLRRQMPTELPDFDTRKTKTSTDVLGSLQVAHVIISAVERIREMTQDTYYVAIDSCNVRSSVYECMSIQNEPSQSISLWVKEGPLVERPLTFRHSSNVNQSKAGSSGDFHGRKSALANKAPLIRH